MPGLRCPGQPAIKAPMRLPSMFCLLALGTLPLHAADLPGQKPDGSVLLPNQWSLRPVGQQVGVGDFPVNMVVHPGGKFAAVLHCGYSQHEIVVLDLTTRAIASRTKINEAFYGLSFSKDGARLFCSGSAEECIRGFQFANGQLSNPVSYQVQPASTRGIPCGLAVSGDGRMIYVANLWGQNVTRLILGEDGPAVASTSLVDAAVADAAKTPSAAPQIPPSTDDPSITKRDNQLLDTTDPNAPFPYACVLDENRSRLYISLWGQAAVAVLDTKTLAVKARWATEEHPNEMVLSKDGNRLFVANANRNTVSVLNTANGRTTETLLAELTPSAPPGNTPNSLALSPDGNRLYVASTLR